MVSTRGTDLETSHFGYITSCHTNCVFVCTSHVHMKKTAPRHPGTFPFKVGGCDEWSEDSAPGNLNFIKRIFRCWIIQRVWLHQTQTALCFFLFSNLRLPERLRVTICSEAHRPQVPPRGPNGPVRSQTGINCVGTAAAATCGSVSGYSVTVRGHFPHASHWWN